MSRSVNAATVLAAAVATAGTFTVPYPAGKTAGDFSAAGAKHKLSALQVIYEAPKDFTIALGSASATVTWKASNTLPAGTSVRVQFDIGGDAVDEDFAVVGSAKVPVNRVLPLRARLVSFGSPAAKDDASLMANAAVGGAGALTLITAGKTFDCARNVIITSAGNDSGVTFDVVGQDEYAQVQRETITGANAGVASGVKAFKKITSITASGASAGNVKCGKGNVFGYPCHIPSTAAVLYTLQDGAVPSNAPTNVAGLSPLTKPTATTADERGTFAPNTNAANVPDGARGFAAVVLVPNREFIGSVPYSG